LEVVMFNAARSTAGASDLRGLVFAWIVLASLAIGAIAAQSVILGVLGGAFALVTIPWTTGKVGGRALARRLERRAG
jgi:hypothetical protein